MEQINYLHSKVSDIMNNNLHISNELFKQTIKDHKLLLQETSKIYYVSSQIRSIYLHRDNLFLSRSLGIDKSLLWIIKYINDIPEHNSVLEAKQLYIPSIDTINKIIDKSKILKSYINNNS